MVQFWEKISPIIDVFLYDVSCSRHVWNVVGLLINSYQECWQSRNVMITFAAPYFSVLIDLTNIFFSSLNLQSDTKKYKNSGED